MAAEPIPDTYPQVTPYLCVDGAADAIAFYEQVLGAKERMRLAGPDAKIGHAELEIGNGLVMLSDEYADMEMFGPKAIGGTAVTIAVYVEDVDATFKTAIDAGATSLREPEDRFYGDRAGQFLDPWGHRWNVQTHVEDVAPDEIMRRASEYSEG